MPVRRWFLAGLLVLVASVGAACSAATILATATPTPTSVPTRTLATTAGPTPTAALPTVPALASAQGRAPTHMPAPSSGAGPRVSSTPTITITPTPTPSLAAPVPPSDTAPRLDADLGEAAFGYAKELSEELGPRASGTEQERAAAEYLASRFEEFGYAANLQPFVVESLSIELSGLTLDEPGPEEVDAIPLGRSATGMASGTLVAVGPAKEEDIPDERLEGQIVLVERGLITFEEKVNRVGGAGAVGAVSYNNKPGNFQGVLLNSSVIPAVAVSQEEGERIKTLLSTDEVRATMTVVAAMRPSQNVIAEKPGTEERVVVLGVHYDTVPDVAGANDNASGTAVLLALAQRLSQSSFPFSVRFIAFGAEELGLRGSRHYIDSLSDQQRQQITAMLNFDALGTGESIGVSGAPELTGKVVELGSTQGILVERGGGPRGASSDHASFAEAGIPAVIFFSQSFSRIHSPDDALEHVNPRLLGDGAYLALSLLELPALLDARVP